MADAVDPIAPDSMDDAKLTENGLAFTGPGTSTFTFPAATP